jgi:hypothetical protein
MNANQPYEIIYDPATKRVFAINHTGKSATVIEAAVSARALSARLATAE